MIAIHLEAGAVLVRDIPVPARPAGFALIRLIAAGICNTDLELRCGYYGFSGIPGHEFVGEVVEADSLHLQGKRVVGEINLACNHCAWCAKGLGRHCPSRDVLGIVRHPGAFQEFFTLPESNLHVVPEEFDSSSAVFAEPVAAACEILDQVPFPAGATIAVLGDGKLGLLIAQVLRAHGYAVHLFGRHAEKVRIAQSAGARGSVAAISELPVAEYGWVVDATGSPSGLAAAVRMAQPRGTVIMKSTVHGPVALDAAPVIVNEITLVGSRCGRFEPALELLRAGAIDTASMIAATLPLSSAPEAFDLAAQPGVLKVLFTGSP